MAKLPKLWHMQQGLLEFQQQGVDLLSDPIPGGGVPGETISRVQLTLTLYVQSFAQSSGDLPQADILWGLYNGTSVSPDPALHNNEPRQWMLHGRISFPPLSQIDIPQAPNPIRWITGSTRVEVQSEGQRAQGGIHANFRIAARQQVLTLGDTEIQGLYWHIRFLKTLHLE